MTAPEPRTSPTPTPTPGGGNWFTRGGWWFLVHLLSVGVLAPVPFTQAALASRRLSHRIAAVVYLVAVLGAFTLIGTAPEDAAGDRQGPGADLGGALIVTILLGGLVHLVVVRHQVYGPGRAGATAPARPAGPGTIGPTAEPDPAVATALAARARRDEARALAAKDPLLARELRVGRPDLPRTYDDGGLVDLNSAPAPVLSAVLGIDHGLVARIVEARVAVGRFGAVDDVFAWADLPVEVWDVVRDRGVVLSTT